jgi:serine O-acetyltransferase
MHLVATVCYRLLFTIQQSVKAMASDFRLKEQLPDLTNRIVQTYSEVGTINHLGHSPLPNYEVIIDVAESIKEIIYPGYRRREGLHLGNITYHVGDLIDGLHDKLTQQVARALRHDAGVDEHAVEETDFEALAQTMTIQFLERIPDIRRLLATDVEAALAGDPSVKGVDEVIFCYPGLEAVTIYRVAHELYRLNIPFIPRMLTEWAHRETGIDIHPGAQIQDHFFIDHGTGVVIGQTCEIGRHVKIYQGVTLGALSFQTDEAGGLLRGDEVKRHPTIEDHVVIYANATVLGGKTIVGHDSVIGSSVWITRSVQPRTTVVLEKPKLRERNEQNDDLVAEANYQI